MPTKNRRAAVYLPPDVDEALAIFKDNRRIDGDSAALITILREFFELGATTAHHGSPEIEERIVLLEQSQSVLQGQVQSLERTVEYLLSELRLLRSDLPGSSLGSSPLPSDSCRDSDLPASRSNSRPQLLPHRESEPRQ